MTRLQYFCSALICTMLGVTMINAPLALAQSKGESVRPEVGKPLQAARDLMKSQRNKEALAKISEADAVGNKTAYETFLIQQMRGSAAAAAGDLDTAIKAFEAAIASGRLGPSEQLRMVQAVGTMHYRAKDYSKAATWISRYLKEGGNDAQMRTLLVQSYYLSNDCASVSRLVQGEERRRPSEEELQIMQSCFLKQKDNNGYLAALEKLVTYYPKKEYWTELVNRMQRKRGFSERLSLDVMRLKRATGNLNSAGDYMEMTQLALQAGVAGEAKKIVEEGFAAGVLGSGPQADRHTRLRDLVNKTLADDKPGAGEAEAAAAKDGSALVNIGFSYVANGQSAKGIALMEQGIRKGARKRPEDAKLHLGIAYLLANQKAKAIQTFKGVQGTDGTADLARLWILHSSR